MQKNNNQATENEYEDHHETSDNVSENVRYIKQLELQRLVLNKLIDSNLDKLSKAQNNQLTKSESGKLLIKKKKK